MLHNDNILELVENGVEPNAITTGLICKQSGIGSRESFADPVSVGQYSVSLHLYFKKFGLYFHLYAEGTTQWGSPVAMTLDMEPVYYHVRCDETVYYNRSGIGVTNTLYFHSYQGAKNLNEVWFRGRLTGKLLGISATTSWVEIRVNY